jgi:hypothetical protein
VLASLSPSLASKREGSSNSARLSDPNDDTQWLTYWVVFAAFTLLEYFSRTLLYYFPFYYPAKLVFLVWCFLPQTLVRL